MQQSKKKKVLTYRESEIWSLLYPQWKNYVIKKPRLPTANDSAVNLIDEAKYRPVTLGGYIGDHNAEILKSLKLIVDNFGKAGNLPAVICFCGKSGTGKTSIVNSYMNELCAVIDIASEKQRKKFILQFDAKSYIPRPKSKQSHMPTTDHVTDDIDTMLDNITKFYETPIDKLMVDSDVRICFIDNVDLINVNGQFALKRLIDNYGKLKWIITARDKSKLLKAIQDKGTVLRTKVSSDRDALAIILNILVKERIGYDREGLQKLFEIHAPNYSLTEMLTLIQKTFIKYHYISPENIARSAHLHEGPVMVPYTRAVEPFIRCPKCTLYPPCQHLTYKDLVQKAQERRSELPRYIGGLCCPDWSRYGYCTIFSKYGHCSLDHPTDIHTIEPPIIRCHICTVKWPCNVCDYSKARQNVINNIENIKILLKYTSKLILPNTPAALTMQLDEMNRDWRLILIQLERVFTSAQKLDILKEISAWLATSYTVDKADYNRRFVTIKNNFGELLNTPFLKLKGIEELSKEEI
jgi:hypothetical protein